MGRAVERFFAALRAHGIEPKKSGDKAWKSLCPAHRENTPSLSIREGDRGVRLKCFAGCETESVAESLGLRLTDLFDDAGESEVITPVGKIISSSADRPTLKKLAEHCGVDPDFLESQGWEQSGARVEVPYFDRSGEEIYRKIRMRMEGKPKYVFEGKFSEGQAQTLYGLWHLDDWLESESRREVPSIIVCEGETDCMALWSRSIPALGVPGVSSVKKSFADGSILDGFSRVFVIREPGSAGASFPVDLATQLRQVGWSGSVLEVSLHPYKDPAEASRVEGENFLAFLRKAIKTARPVRSALVRMSTVERKDVTFLWHPYLPDRKLSLLAGPEGQGKGLLVAWLASAISIGLPLPGSDKGEPPGKVLYFAGEDDFEDTLAPRLYENGADLDMIYGYDVANEGFSFGGKSFDLLAEMIEQEHPRLMIFDPIMDFMGSKVDINSQAQVSAVLSPLARIAAHATHPVSILIVAHQKKGFGQNGESAVSSVMASKGFTTKPRSVMLLFPDPARPFGESGGILVHPKANSGPKGASLKFSLKGMTLNWEGESELTAGDLVKASSAPPDQIGMLEAAKDFLRQELRDGELDGKAVMKSARAAGIQPAALNTARFALGVKSRKLGFKNVYLWSLPGFDKADDEAMPM